MQPAWSERDSRSWSCPWWTSMNQLVDLVSAKICKAGRSAPPSPMAPSPSVEGQQTPLSDPAPKRAHHAPTTTSFALRGEDDIAGGIPSHGFLQGHCWPLGKLSAFSGAAGGTSCPLPHPLACTSCQILQASQLKGLW